MHQQNLKQLAIDIVEGKVFGSWMVAENDINKLPLIFLPLALNAGKDLGEVYGYYQYYDRAISKKYGKYPCFSRMHYLNVEQGKQVEVEVTKYKSLKEGFLK